MRSGEAAATVAIEKKARQSSIDRVNELRVKRWPKTKKSAESLKIADLFCGCGGLTLGAFQASHQLSKRLEVALALDAAQDAINVFAQNFSRFGRSSIVAGDITDYLVIGPALSLNEKGTALAEKVGKIDVLLAGPPCQGNSDLNNRSRRSDPRNDLYMVPAAFAEAMSPDLVLIENVPAVVHGDANVVSRTISLLSQLGYACEEFRADLTAFGLPQTRRRHVLIASRRHTGVQLKRAVLQLPSTSHTVQLKEFISDIEVEKRCSETPFYSASRPSEENKKRIDYLFENDLLDLPDHMRPPCHREKKHSYVSMYGRLSNVLPSQTITSGFGSMGQGRFVHPTQRRTITPHEAARIQGFPDYFSFSRATSVTGLRQMIGNAVAPALASTLIATLMS